VARLLTVTCRGIPDSTGPCVVRLIKPHSLHRNFFESKIAQPAAAAVANKNNKKTNDNKRRPRLPILASVDPSSYTGKRTAKEMETTEYLKQSSTLSNYGR
jgi:hypothetical protein